jgi:hypothetical protein
MLIDIVSICDKIRFDLWKLGGFNTEFFLKQ